jgi:hypothetical protein
MLGWLVCSKRVLDWQEIQAAMSLDHESQEFQLDFKGLRGNIEEYCSSLVTVTEINRPSDPEDEQNLEQGRNHSSQRRNENHRINNSNLLPSRRIQFVHSSARK